jgi:hypothetical protein
LKRRIIEEEVCLKRRIIEEEVCWVTEAMSTNV